jgi:hypothetical protein
MSDIREIEISKYEEARNNAMDAYFEARTFLERTKEREVIFEAGFRMAWELLKNEK